MAESWKTNKKTRMLAKQEQNNMTPTFLREGYTGADLDYMKLARVRCKADEY